MAPFLLYAFTAAFALAGYEFVRATGIFPVLIAPMAPAGPGAALLVVAAVVALWKPRLAAVVALVGCVVVWSALLSGTVVSFCFAMLARLAVGIVIPVVVVACLVMVTTLYAAIAATGIRRYLPLPEAWFPQQTFGLKLFAAQQVPRPVRVAALLLYAYLAIASAVVMYEMWQGKTAQNHIYSVWIFDIALLLGMFWIVFEISRGRNWARVLMTLILLLGIRENVIHLRHSAPAGIEKVFVIAILTVSGVVILLLFGNWSAPYFRRS